MCMCICVCVTVQQSDLVVCILYIYDWICVCVYVCVCVSVQQSDLVICILYIHDWICVYVCVLVAQSCLTLCDPMDCSLPGSSVLGILQARILEWVPFPAPGALPDPGIESGSPALQANSLPSEPPGKPIWLNKYYAFCDSFPFWVIVRYQV